MEVDDAIRSRRTHKAYGREPVDRAQLEELLDLARWAPNHNLTNPWRFRVIGPQALERLKDVAGPESAKKLDRAPTLIACSCALSGDPVQDEEDLHATATAAYIVLLAAHGRGPRPRRRRRPTRPRPCGRAPARAPATRSRTRRTCTHPRPPPPSAFSPPPGAGPRAARGPPAASAPPGSASRLRARGRGR